MYATQGVEAPPQTPFRRGSGAEPQRGSGAGATNNILAAKPPAPWFVAEPQLPRPPPLATPLLSVVHPFNPETPVFDDFHFILFQIFTSVFGGGGGVGNRYLADRHQQLINRLP